VSADRAASLLSKLYALDNTLDLKGATKSQIEQAMRGHVLAGAELIDRIKRSVSGRTTERPLCRARATISNQDRRRKCAKDTGIKLGRVDHWLKVKNPAAPAVKREAEEELGQQAMESRSAITRRAENGVRA
jgi:hypothetical protein